jgi:hypothetical protein
MGVNETTARGFQFGTGLFEKVQKVFSDCLQLRRIAPARAPAFAGSQHRQYWPLGRAKVVEVQQEILVHTHRKCRLVFQRCCVRHAATPDGVRDRIVQLALDEPDRSPREIAVTFTDRERSFVSEASVYRLLKARGLITSPAFIVMKAADKFINPTCAINQLW